MNFRILGWVSLALLVIAASPFWLKTINKYTFKTKAPAFLKLLKSLRGIHKIAGGALAVIAIIHGWMALSGQIRLHTGLITYIAIGLTALLGLKHHFAKKKDMRIFKAHRLVALISAALFLVHLIRPWLLFELFGV